MNLAVFCMKAIDFATDFRAPLILGAAMLLAIGMVVAPGMGWVP